MAVGCGAKCAKALLIIFNFIFWLSGCSLLGLGIWLLVDPEKNALFNLLHLEGHEPMMQYLAYGLVGVGGFILLVGIIGCCGALQENKCCLVLYFITLFIVLGAELSIGVLACIYRTKILEELETGLTKKLQTDYGANDKQAFTDAVDFTQYKFNCCGIMGPDDYTNSTWKNSSDTVSKKLNVSLTCCRLTSTDLEGWTNPTPGNPEGCQSTDIKNPDMRHQEGCKAAIEEWFIEESTILIAVGIGVAGLEIFGMIFAICLCRSLGEREA